jgi:hypothetical protein
MGVLVNHPTGERTNKRTQEKESRPFSLKKAKRTLGRGGFCSVYFLIGKAIRSHLRIIYHSSTTIACVTKEERLKRQQ